MYSIIVQLAADEKAYVPSAASLRKWAKQTLKSNIDSGEITLRVVSIPEMTTLNESFRKKAGPTNVLSFPFDTPPEIDEDEADAFLGDIVICAEVVNDEAAIQHKSPDAHWAHMVVHGIYHLLGYDHMIDSEAEIMEGLEIKSMQALGFGNPYDE